MISYEMLLRLMLCVAYEEDAVVDAGWQFFLVVCHHDHRLVVALAECLDDILHQSAVDVVKSVQWFVKNQELWVLDEGSCQENQALLATGEFEEPEDLHPETALVHILVLWFDVETHGIHQSAGYDTDGWQISLIGAMQLWRNVADMLLDVPDALAASSWITKEGDVAGVTLWVVCADKAQQRRLICRLRSVRSKPSALRSSPSSQGL